MSIKQEKLNEKLIYAEVVLRSRPGVSKATSRISADRESPKPYKADSSIVDKVKAWFIEREFSVIASSSFGLSIVGPRDLYCKYFNTDVRYHILKVPIDKERTREEVRAEFAEAPKIPEELVSEIEEVYIPPNGRYLSPMPSPSYYHLVLPDDISRITNADGAHSRGLRGAGVKVAMVDSGLVVGHEYFNNRGYKMTVHSDPNVNPTTDEIGHGTGMAANLLAVAPDCDFHLFKPNPNLMPTPFLAAFRNASAEPNVRVISCSWSFDRFDQNIEDEINTVIAGGITVVFACGNGTPPEFPSCMPGVVSVGGAYPESDGTLEASNYASSGINPNYPTSPTKPPRQCPDICGVCGDKTHCGRLIVMPTQIGSELDKDCSSFLSDGTPTNDGWFVSSGTSAAAAQLAGGVAVVLSAKPNLSPSEVKQVLMDTATDVKTGFSATGDQAVPGKDNATGAGLINLKTAVDNVNSPVLQIEHEHSHGHSKTYKKQKHHKTHKKHKKSNSKTVITRKVD